MDGERPHIVIVTEYFPPQIGGLAKLAQTTRNVLADHGYKVSVLWVSEEAVDAPGVYALDAAYSQAGPILGRVRRSWAIWRRLRRLDQVDPVHAVEASNWNVIGLVTAKMGPWPVVTRVSTSVLQASGNRSERPWSFTHSLLAALERSTLRDSKRVVFNSNEHQLAYTARLGLPRMPLTKTCVIPLASPDPGMGRAPEGRPALLFVGRGTWRKGVDLLDQVMCRSCEGGVEFDVHLVGLHRHDLPQFFSRSQATVAIHLHMDIDEAELGELFRRASVVIMPSRYESFGLVTVEAMAHARPVVVFDISAPRDIVVDGETGFLVPPFDVTAMADAIQRLIEDQALAERLGMAGRERYLALYHPNRFSAHMCSLYDQLLVSPTAQQSDVDH